MRSSMCRRRYSNLRRRCGPSAQRKADVQTVVVWGLCAAIFAYKIFLARVKC